MQLNVLDDLAEALKALDGKKIIQVVLEFGWDLFRVGQGFVQSWFGGCLGFVQGWFRVGSGCIQGWFSVYLWFVHDYFGICLELVDGLFRAD